MKVLIVEDEADILELLCEITECAVDEVEILRAATVKSAQELLTKYNDIDLLIADQNLPDGLGSQLYSRIQEENRNLPYILCSSTLPGEIEALRGQTIYGNVQKPHIVEPLTTLIQKREQEWRQANNIQEQKPRPDYFKVGLKNIVKVTTIPCDLYIRLSDSKYVKVLAAGDLFGETDSRHYENKNVDHLYIERAFAAQFLNNLAKNMLSIIGAKKIFDNDVIELGASIHSSVQKNILSIGITPDTQNIIREHLNLSVRFLSTNTDLKKLLSRFKTNPESYISSHSVGLCYISGALLSMMSWRSDAAYFKISLAAFMHDILLQNQELAAIETLDELNKKQDRFTEEEITLFKKHPQETAQLIRSLSGMPTDVDIIVLQHHERPDGTGFPHKISGLRMSPISALFNIAHDVARHMVFDESFNLKRYILADHPEYQHSPFKTVLRDIRAYIEKHAAPS